MEEVSFQLQRIQTDRGRELFAYKVRERLLEWAAKFQPVKPRSHHLNGQGERIIWHRPSCRQSIYVAPQAPQCACEYLGSWLNGSVPGFTAGVPGASAVR